MSTEVRLLPLVQFSANDGVANLLARMLTDDPALAAEASQSSLLILTGIQTFLDTGGDYLAVERLWEPVIVAREMEKAYGPEEGAKKAVEMGAAARAVCDVRGAGIYEQVAGILQSMINKRVDKSA